MFSKLLIPIDGSEPSLEAARAGVDFAKGCGAAVSAIYVQQPLSSVTGFDGVAASYAVSVEDFEKASEKEAHGYLEPVHRYAQEQGVKMQMTIVNSHNIPEGICKFAVEHNCDLIFLSSHNRKGLSRLLLGSVTDRVIRLSTVSVLVHKPDVADDGLEEEIRITPVETIE